MSRPATSDDLNAVWAILGGVFVFFLLMVIGIFREIDQIRKRLRLR